jgi:trans-2,3-dihydro-3-hydroxyanthranilate isomerase
VVLDAGDLSPERMQDVAREMNLSETTFVTAREPRDGGFPVRIFTPTEEMPFAGHPTLGTAWVIREHVARARTAGVALDLGVGRVPVGFEPSPAGGELAWLTAPPIELGAQCPAAPVARALGLAPDEIDARGPVQQVAAGTRALLVPLVGLAALRRSRLDLAAFEPLAREGFPRSVYVFCSETGDPAADVCARLFFDAGGVREDPATGSSAAFLGAYLLRHRFLGRSDLALRIAQGAEIRRPSALWLRARDSAEGPEIRVGGEVVASVEGRLL